MPRADSTPPTDVPRDPNAIVSNAVQLTSDVFTANTTYEICTSSVVLMGSATTAVEAITPFLPLIGVVAELTQKILEAYNNAQINKRSCRTLVDRVQAADVAIQVLVRNKHENEDKFRDRNYYHCFVRFVTILKDIKKFIFNVTQMSGLRKFFQSGTIKSTFERYIKEFDSIVMDLNLAMVVASEEQRKKDFRDISESFDTIMKFLEHIQGNVAEVKTQNNEKIIEMSTNFSIIPQIKSQIDQLAAKTKPKPKFIEPKDLLTSRKVDNHSFNQDNGKILNRMYMLRDVVCKRIVLTPDENNPEYAKQKKQSERIKVYLTIWANLRNSPYVLEFLGLTKLDGFEYIVCECAEKGNLKEIYERGGIDWPTKIQLAVDICRGIAYIHGCNILHHDIRCENILVTDRWSPKITNFEYSRGLDAHTIDLESSVLTMVHWFPPEKMHNYQIDQHGKVVFDRRKYSPYTRQSEIFSFGMTLWELAYEKIPYKDWGIQKIQEHVTSNKREVIQPLRRNEPQYVNNYLKIVKEMWKSEPDSRPDIVNLFNGLYEIFDKIKPDYSPLCTPTRQDSEVTNTPVFTYSNNNEANNNSASNNADDSSELPEFSGDFSLDNINNINAQDPPDDAIKVPISLSEGIKAHKAKDRKKAWECFMDLSENGNMKAKYWKGYYYYEGYHVEKDHQKAAQLFKEAADNGIPDAQLRYAICLISNKPNGNYSDDEINDIVKYMTLAANNENLTALYNLADMYYKGKVVKEANKEKGLEYLRLAAIKGHDRAIKIMQEEGIDIYWGKD